MRVKKLLVAAGVVCVVTPAALALTRGGDGDYLGNLPSRIAESVGLAVIDGLMNGQGEVGEAKVPHSRDKGGKLPFRPGHELAPRLADLGYNPNFLESGDIGPAGGIPPSGAVAASGGAVGGAAQQKQAAGDASSSQGLFGSIPSGRSFARGGGGAGGGGGGGSGSGGGSSVTGDLLEEEERPILLPTDGSASVISAPLPSSVWLMLAGITGFFIVGRRRGGWISGSR